MASFSALDILKTAPRKPIEELFDAMWMPHWTNYLSPSDVENLRRIATSKKYAGDMNLKYRMIDNIMKSRGFRRFAGGTNRLVFAHYEDPTILAKVAVDKVGMTDNPYEYKAQVLIKPYCTKMLQVTDCGTVGFAERVLPITSVKEFKLIAGDVLDIIMNKIIGKYIMEDIGTEFYMNWGIRKGFGPVLLDYPYVFETEGAKLYCQNVLPNGMICNHEIDYDAGFNKLVCLGCGKIYTASDLKKDRAMNNIIIRKGGTTPMNVKIVRGGEVITQNYSSDTIRKPEQATARRPVADRRMHVTIVRGNGEVITMLKDGQVYSKDTMYVEDPQYEQKSVTLETEVETVEGENPVQTQSGGEKDENDASVLKGDGKEDQDLPSSGVQEADEDKEVVHEEAPTDLSDTDTFKNNGESEVQESDEQARQRELDKQEALGKPTQVFSSSNNSRYGLNSNTKKIPIGSTFIDTAGEY